MQGVHTRILHQIVHVIEARGKVPERVRIRGHEYRLTYLDDHLQRLQEALRRRDPDRLGMLYGQLSSKVKYQLLRRATKRQAASSARKPSAARTRKPVSPRKKTALKKRAAVAKKGSGAAKRGASRAARG